MRDSNRKARVSTRRDFLRQGLSLAAVAACQPACVAWAGAPAAGGAALAIGSRRELLVDDFLIASLTGAELKLHKPEPRDVAIVCDAAVGGQHLGLLRDLPGRRSVPHVLPRLAHRQDEEGDASGVRVLRREPRRRHLEEAGAGPVRVRRARSRTTSSGPAPGTHNFTPFKDANPACAPDARYKALAGGTTTLDGKKKGCLNALKSADGIHWTMMSEGVITAGAFDSQNLAFWDAVRGEYRAYWRIFAGGVRAIRTATSKDFIHWENQADLTYVDSPAEHLYTNAVMPYFRAPHLFIGFPTRFQPKTQQVEPVFMTSRDGVAVSPLERGADPDHRAEGPRRQPQQLHDLGPAATARPAIASCRSMPPRPTTPARAAASAASPSAPTASCRVHAAGEGDAASPNR